MKLQPKDSAKPAKPAPGQMKLAFVEVRYNKDIDLPRDFIEKTPQRVILFTNIQYHPQYDRLKGQLEDAGREVVSVRPKHAWNEGQILGCSVEDWEEEGVDGFVYVGDGFFHPKAILFENTKPVYMYDPEAERQYTLEQKDIEKILKRKKGAISTFHASQKVGVLITSKYGQNRLKESFKLRELYPEKEFFFFLADIIDFASLEDFPFVQVYVNTACPRIMDDHEKLPRPVLNLQDVTGEDW